MAIFVSYNRKDKHFVDNIVAGLTLAGFHIWLDRWELSIGDSLIEKIQGAIGKAEAILVVISRNSVESTWCKKELTAGLTRELEEKKVLVLPCVIDDCKIPLFLRDKLYADFHTEPMQAFSLLRKSLAKYSSPFQGRHAENPTCFTDWAVDWRRTPLIGSTVRWVFVSHGNSQPHTIVCQCIASGNRKANKDLDRALHSGSQVEYTRNILSAIMNNLGSMRLPRLITDHFEQSYDMHVIGNNGQEYDVLFLYQRLGRETGMDTLIHLDNYIRNALEDMTETISSGNNRSQKAL